MEAWDSALSRHFEPLDPPQHLSLNAFHLLRAEHSSPHKRAAQVVAVPLTAHDTCLRVAGGAEQQMADPVGHGVTEDHRNLRLVPVDVAREVFNATVEDAGQGAAVSVAEKSVAEGPARGSGTGENPQDDRGPAHRPAALLVRLLGRDR